MSGPFQPDDPEESVAIAQAIGIFLLLIAVAFGIVWLIT